MGPVCVLCPAQFHLSPADKELLQREDREESQQEILRRIAKELPIYTRTNSGGVYRQSPPPPRLGRGQGLRSQVSGQASPTHPSVSPQPSVSASAASC